MSRYEIEVNFCCKLIVEFIVHLLFDWGGELFDDEIGNIVAGDDENDYL